MHAGHFSTLEEVVAHYSRLESEVELGHREELLLPLEDESGTRFTDLVEFLVSLEGEALDESLSSQPASPFLED
jgi:cytochrome c peroxidase